MERSLQVTAALNARLQEKLATTGCQQGRLKAEYTANLLLSLSCIRTKDNRSMLLWDFDYPLQKAIRDYLEICGPDTAVLEVDIDLSTNTFHYQHLSKAQHKLQQQAAAKQEEKETQQRLLENKERLAADTAPFGRELAAKVADALEKGGSIGYGHRDYCGMGLEYKNGAYSYGEIWDGSFMPPVNVIKGKNAFTDWLSQQSNASLSNIHAKEPFYWGNQVITRERLEQFLNYGGA